MLWSDFLPKSYNDGPGQSEFDNKRDGMAQPHLTVTPME